MSVLVPAILAKTPQEFHGKLNLVAPFCRKVQVDIMDGVFVENKTIQVNQIPRFNSPTKLELHLMMKDPLSIFQYEKHPAVSTVIIHYEAVDNALEALKFMPPRIIKGIAINPETEIKNIEEIIKVADLALIMTVNPGEDGQEMLPDVIQKVGEIRAIRPGIITEIDGGVKKDNAAEVASTGVDQVVVGSLLYQSKNLKRTMKELMLELGDYEGVSA